MPSSSEAADLHLASALSPNYDFVISQALSLSGVENPKVLDYGCGLGTLVARARRQGLDFHGVDTFEGHYGHWSDKIDPDALGRVSKIQGSRIEADDATFDVVVANQVFEHVFDPEPALREIARVLKPGGAFLALFPTRDVWFEGHFGIYFAHWLSKWPDLQRAYLFRMRQLGFGLHGKGPPEEWADRCQKLLREVVVHRTMDEVQHLWVDAFGALPVSAAREYMRHRLLTSRLKTFASLAAYPLTGHFLEFVCRVRAGRVLVVRKPR